VAGPILPLAVVSILAACGSGGSHRAETLQVSGQGFSFEAPAGWHVSRTKAGVVARGGGSLVSVTRFALRRPYDPSQFAAASAELDRVADKLAAQAGATVTDRSTTTVADRSIRAYSYADTKVGFVLVGRREYELLCVGQSDACALLFSSFAIS